MRKTIIQIEEELDAMRALTPTGRHALKTRRTIELIKDVLRGEVDLTSMEFEDLPESLQMAARDTQGWMDGDCDARPSTGWGELCE